MAEIPEQSVDVPPAAETDICGLIMPISETTSHSVEHWTAVRTLLTRAIETAGLQAVPVWINASAERVSERIIANIFEFPIVIADITDLNPNVMFELGMRLSSKKPTLVVMERGSSIPFDVRDFHVHIYPPHLSMLEMETSLKKIIEDLGEKMTAWKENRYIPFLGNVVVDVVSPDKREVSFNQFVLDELQAINRRLSQDSNRFAVSKPSDMNQYQPGQPYPSSTSYATISKEKGPELEANIALGLPSSIITKIGENETEAYYAFQIPRVDNDQADDARSFVRATVVSMGGSNGVPSDIAKRRRARTFSMT